MQSVGLAADVLITILFNNCTEQNNLARFYRNIYIQRVYVSHRTKTLVLVFTSCTHTCTYIADHCESSRDHPGKNVSDYLMRCIFKNMA